MRRLISILLFTSSCMMVHAQDKVAVVLARQLEESRTNYPAMRPQVFFSQQKYAPGDTAFFRLFILTEAERILAERSLLTLELIHPNGKTCSRQVISCQRFGAANQLILPDSLSPGMYEVRLFSDRMTLAYGLTTKLMVAGERQLVRQPQAGDGLVFFPEGGHLVEGALNRVVVRTTGKVPGSASLYSDEGKVMPFAFDGSGIAEMQLVPQKNRTYRVEYMVGEKILSAPLPPTEPSAIALRIYPGPRKTYVLDLSTGPKGPRSATLVLVAGRQLLHSQEVRFKSDHANILASAGLFPEGFSEVFVVDENLQVLAYRPMYVTPMPAAQISISGLPESVGLRQDVKVDLKLVDAEGRPVSAGLAIAVVPEEVRLFPIRTPDPTLELRPVPPTFDWTLPRARTDQEIIASVPPRTIVPEYPPLLHRSNLALTGKAYSTDPSSSLPYLSRMVIYLHKDLIQYETAIDGAGNFEFSKIFDFIGSDKVFYQVLNGGKLVPHVEVDWSSNLHEFAPVSSERYTEGTQPDAYGVLRKRKRAIDRSFNYFQAIDNAAAAVENYNAPLEKAFREADFSMNPGEYVPFSTMRELILEVVPYVKFRVHGKDSIVQIDLLSFSPLVAQRYAEGNALYVIDGYLTTDTHYLMALSPKDVVAIKVVQDIDKLNRLENLAWNGILFVQTRMPERTRRDLERKLHVIEGLSPILPMATKYPDKPRVPDLRSLLFWTPLMDADSTGTASFSFKTSDLPGTYWVRVMGTTTTGHLVTAEQRFVVNFK